MKVMFNLKNKTILRLCGILFLALSASWLLGPSLENKLLPGPNLISSYETTYAGLSALFRIFDAAGAVLLFIVVGVTSKQLQKNWGRFVPITLMTAAVLMFFDTVVPVQCTVFRGLCEVQFTSLTILHGVESLILSGIIVCLSLYLAYYFKHGRWFLVVQVTSFGLGIIAHSYGPHWLFAIQAGYQMLLAYWIYTVVFSDAYSKVSEPAARFARNALAIWVGINGLIALSLSWHRVDYGRIPSTLFFASNSSWLLGHTILVGLLLLYLARQLYLGDRRAFIFASALLLSEVLHGSITRRGWLIVPVFGLPLLVLIYYKNVFDRHGSFVGFTSRLRFIAIGLVIITAVITLGSLGFRLHDHQDWDKSPFDGARVIRRVALLEITPDNLDSPRTKIFSRLLTIFGASVYAWVIVGIFLPQSSFRNQNELTDYDMLAALRAHSTSSEDYFKYWPSDKQYYRTKNGAVIAFAQNSGVIIALADPIGNGQFGFNDIAEFLKLYRGKGFKSAWLMVGDDGQPKYQRAGYKLVQIGSSARVDIAKFCSVTIRNKWWRWQLNRGDRNGYEYSINLPPHNPELISQLKQVSDAWLTRSNHREQTFAMGYFDAGYLQACRVHCLRNADGALVAFANQVPVFGANNQTTVDMIRFLPDSEGAMQVLLASTLKKLNDEQQFNYFDLGLVPLANVDNRLAKIITQFASNRFSAHGLTQFKNKFEPEWQPDYLAYDGDSIDLAKIFIALNKVMEAGE